MLGIATCIPTSSCLGVVVNRPVGACYTYEAISFDITSLDNSIVFTSLTHQSGNVTQSGTQFRDVRNGTHCGNDSPTLRP